MRMTSTTTDYEKLYHQAFHGALVVQHQDPGVVQLMGKDRLSFLHRMSTNAIEGLNSWSLRPTTLTTPLARVIDRLWIINRENDLLAVTSPHRGQIAQAWLNQHIFFNDHVMATIPDEKWSLWGVYGPAAAEAVQEHTGLDFSSEPDAAIPIRDGLGFYWRTPGGIRLLLKPDGEATAADRWPAAKSEVATAVFDTLRIEAGYPLFGSEFDEESLPLEAGLQSTIDFHKGCYTGQEIIARMDSRDQLARQLVGFHLDGPSTPGQLLTMTGQSAGKLTSCACSPRLGWIGLGIIMTRFLKDNSSFALADSGQHVRRTQLPFALME